MASASTRSTSASSNKGRNPRSRSCRPSVRHRPSCLRHLSEAGRGRGDRLARHSQMPTANQHSSKRKACVNRARSLTVMATRNAQAESCLQLRLPCHRPGMMRSLGLQISGTQPSLFGRNLFLTSRGLYQSTDARSRQVQNCWARSLALPCRPTCRAN